MKKHLRVGSLLTMFCLMICGMPWVPVSADVALPPEIILPQGYILSVGDDSLESGSVGKGSENGLCMVYLLSDGSFLIYDGGQGNANFSPDAHHLMKQLKRILKKNGLDEEEIRVRAWVFTHAHKDHYGFAGVFFSNYAEELTIDEFWFNPIEGDPSGVDLLGILNRYCPEVPIRRLVEGEVIELPGISAEVLYTVESIGYTHARNDQNAASCVMMLTLGSKRVLMTGDASPSSWNLLVSKYPAVNGVSKLKCDYLQVSHHGARGAGTDAGHALADAEYLVIPAGEELMRMTVTPGAFCYWEPTRNLYAQYDDAHKIVAGWHDPYNSEETQRIQHFVTADYVAVDAPETLEKPVLRMNEGSEGLRFISRISKKTLDQLAALQEEGILKPGAEGYSFGTVICMEGSLDEVSEFTAEALAAEKEKYVDVTAKDGIQRVGEDLLISVALVDVKLSNRLVNFAAIAYVEYHLTDGRTVRIYGEYDGAKHARSLYTTALYALSDVREEATREQYYGYCHEAYEYYEVNGATGEYEVRDVLKPRYSMYTDKERETIKRLAAL